MNYIESKINTLKDRLKLYNEIDYTNLDLYRLNNDILVEKGKKINYTIDGEPLASELIKDIIEIEDDEYIKESIQYFHPKNLDVLAVAIAVGALHSLLSTTIHIEGWDTLSNIIENLDMKKYAKKYDTHIFEPIDLFAFKEQVLFPKRISNLMCLKYEVEEYMLNMFRIIWLEKCNKENKKLNSKQVERPKN